MGHRRDWTGWNAVFCVVVRNVKKVVLLLPSAAYDLRRCVRHSTIAAMVDW